MAVDFVCGLECRILSAGAALAPVENHWHGVNGTPAISTTTVRSGTASLRINPAAATQYMVRTVNRTVVSGRVYVRFAAFLTTSETAFLALQNVNGTGSLRMGTGGQLRIKVGAGTTVDIATLSLNTWYRIDFVYDSSGGTATLKARLDGGTEVTASAVQVSASVTDVRFGLTGADTVDMFFDDIILGNGAGDYPIGRGYVERLKPNGDGTHSFTAGDFRYNAAGANILTSATDVSTFVDDDDLSSIADFIAQRVIRSTGYVEVLFENPASTHDAQGVAVVSSWHASTTGADTVGLHLIDGGTESAVTDDAGDDLTDVSNTTVGFHQRLYLTAPSGGAWTKAKLDALKARMGYSTDVIGEPFWDGIMLEVAYLDNVVTPPLATLATATFAPTVTVAAGGTVITPPAASLALATFAPKANLAVIPPVAAIATTSFAPKANLAVVPPLATLATATFAPVVSAGGNLVVTPPATALTLATFAPQLRLVVTPGALAIATSTFAPQIRLVVTPPTTAIVTAMFVPVIARGIIPPTVALATATFAPTIVNPKSATPPTARLGLRSSTFRADMLALSPVAYFRLGEAVPGTGTAADLMGTHDGTYVGSPTSVAGALAGDPDTAVDFPSGGTAWVVIPNASDLNLVNEFGILAWVQPDVTTSVAIFEKTVGGAVNTSYSLFIESGWLTGRVVKTGVGFVQAAVPWPGDSAWHFAAMTYDGSKVRVSIDSGAQDTSIGTATAPIDGGAGESRIGALGGSIYVMDGRMDDVVITPTAPTLAQIQARHVSGSVGLAPKVGLGIVPGVTALTLAGQAPTVTASAAQTVTPGVATLALSAFAPVLPRLLVPGPASLTTSSFAPVATATDHKVVTPPTTAIRTDTKVLSFPGADDSRFEPGFHMNDLSGPFIVPPGGRVTITLTSIPASGNIGIRGLNGENQWNLSPVAGVPFNFDLDASGPHTIIVYWWSGGSYNPSLSGAGSTTYPFAPVVALGVVPGATALAISTFAPRANLVVSPPTSAIASSTFAPVLRLTVIPGVVALATTTLAPTVATTAHQTIVPGVASLTTAAFAPAVNLAVIAPAGALSIATFAPRLALVVVPPIATLTTATFAPRIALTIVPGTTALVTSGLAPVVSFTAHQTIVPPVAALTLTTFVPVAGSADNQVATPGLASLTMAAFAPLVVTPRLVVPGTVTLATATFAPLASTPRLVTPGPAALTASTFAPTVATPARATPDPVAIATTGLAPDVAVTSNQTIVPSPTSVAMTAFAPDVVAGDTRLVTPGLAVLILTGYAPSVTGRPPWPTGGVSVAIITRVHRATATVTRSGTVSADPHEVNDIVVRRIDRKWT